jgi:hypothetical protein
MYWLPSMGSPKIGSSKLPVIGENRCSRKCVNKTKGPKILPTKHSRGFRLQLIENWAQNYLSKIAYLQRLMGHSLAISKNFTAHQNKDTHSVPKSWATDRSYCDYYTRWSVITKGSFMCLVIYILKQRAQHLLVWNNASPHVRKPPNNRHFPLEQTFPNCAPRSTKCSAKILKRKIKYTWQDLKIVNLCGHGLSTGKYWAEII